MAESLKVFEAVYTYIPQESKRREKESKGFFIGDLTDVERYCRGVFRPTSRKDGVEITAVEPRGELTVLDEGEEVYSVKRGIKTLFVRGTRKRVAEYFAGDEYVTGVEEIPARRITYECVNRVEFLRGLREYMLTYSQNLIESQSLTARLERINTALGRDREVLREMLKGADLTRGDEALERILTGIDIERIQEELRR